MTDSQIVYQENRIQELNREIDRGDYEKQYLIIALAEIGARERYLKRLKIQKFVNTNWQSKSA